MSESINELTKAAYERGRRVGLATAALALGFVSFINLLGIEKSLLAIVLAILAMRGYTSVNEVRRRGRLALAFACVHVLTILVVLVLFRTELLEFIKLLHNLS